MVLLVIGLAGQLSVGLIVASLIVKALIAPRVALAATDAAQQGNLQERHTS